MITRRQRIPHRASVILGAIALLVAVVPGIAVAGSVVNISLTDDQSEEPAVAAAEGHVHAVWADDTPDANTNDHELMYAHSPDGGDTWTSKQLTSVSGQVYAPVVAAYGRKVHVAYLLRTGDYETRAIWYMRSLDFGETWSSPQRIEGPTDWATQPDIAVARRNVHITWHAGAGEANIYTVRSRTNGRTWKAVKHLTNNSTFEVGPKVVVLGGGDEAIVLVVWYRGNEDIRFRRSTDNGKTWEKTRRLQRTAGHSYSPDIAARGDNVYVAWVDQTKTPGVGEIFFKKSEDGGNTWLGRDRLSWTDDPSYPPTVSATRHKVAVAWAEAGSSDEVHIRRSTTDGDTWAPMKRITPTPHDSHHPDLASADGRLHVVWVDEALGEDNREIHYRYYGG